MKTEILKTTKENINIAASSIKKGELVGMPTETVYGLAANALNPDSVKNIYSVKGRPSNNPLIVHIADFNELDRICYINDDALKLAKAFWPGPLTILQYKKDIIPDAVTGSLNTVAIRMPSNKIARDLISMSGLPIAAPSANKSGRPSPTLPEHVYNDFNGLIPYIIDGGQCEIGLESTVINVASKPYTVLRPGKISIEEIRQILPDVMLSNNILHEPSPDTVPESPGMMYKHYAPNAKLILVSGDRFNVAKKINELYNKSLIENSRTKILCFDENSYLYPDKSFIKIGSSEHLEELAHKLFALLRSLDEMGIETVYSEVADLGGIGLAIMNRMIRAAAFNIIDVNKIK
ncbi:MAG: L-threonylcarbamoyladenylate synthase [Eubacteriales bacterium]|nr:L-threonylcarbamoyladenylate synthase [Eubacteriales bacterium]